MVCPFTLERHHANTSPSLATRSKSFQSTVQFQAGFCLALRCLEGRGRWRMAPDACWVLGHTCWSQRLSTPPVSTVLQVELCEVYSSSNPNCATDQRPLLEGLSRLRLHHFQFISLLEC